MIKGEQLKQIIGRTSVRPYGTMAHILNQWMPRFGIDQPLTEAHFLAQVMHESGGLGRLEENLNYSADRLLAVFPSYVRNIEHAEELARAGREAIANTVYNGRLGNYSGTHDGWTFRGRGLIQLTGRYNYEEFSGACGIDVVKNPDLVATDFGMAVISACWFWESRHCSAIALTQGVKAVTRAITGGSIGLRERTEILERARGVLCSGDASSYGPASVTSITHVEAKDSASSDEPYESEARYPELSEAHDLTTFCPKCNEESLEVTVEDSGTDPATESGPENHWYMGAGKCTACDYEGEHSDSSA